MPSRVFRARLAAHEDVDGGETVLGPGMDADVRFLEDDDAGDAGARAEVVELGAERGGAGEFGGGAKQALDA